MDIIEVYTTFDTMFGTWNVMTESMQCLFYGSIDEMESFLVEHANEYVEV